MEFDSLFYHLSTDRIVEIINDAQTTICYAGPGIQTETSKAMIEAANRLGREMVMVWIDFSDSVFRMGYGEIEAVKLLRTAGIEVRHAPDLRSALIIVDNEGYTFTPTPLYLEAEPNINVRNALRLSRDQIAEALARMSPAATTIAVTLATTPEEQSRISNLPFEKNSGTVNDIQLKQVENQLKEAPPVKFDLARQVRVFESYLQYVELSLNGAAIQRHRVAIPSSIQQLGTSKDLDHRLRTTFELIENNSALSSKKLEDDLNEIRKNFTPSLGNKNGRVILKSAKPHLKKRLEEFRNQLSEYQKDLESGLEKHLNESKQHIIEYYKQRVIDNPPDALLAQITGNPSEEIARRWIECELDRVFPKAKDLIKRMTLNAQYKDITFETLNQKNFIEMVKKSYPMVDWEKAYTEFKAAGEDSSAKIVNNTL